jgi:hypothetical protein
MTPRPPISTAAPRAIELRQICYSAQTLSELPPGMLALDYQDNTRPDWREYWPIRQFLLKNVLADNTLYGFFSPKFGYKTGLGSADVQAFIHQDSGPHDAYFFSPFWDLSSFFINIFEQGDFFHPGLTQASQKFVDSIGLSTPVKFQVTHSQNTVFCNYIVANKTFWLKWLALGERLFFAAEHPEADPQLQALLKDDTTYGEQRLPLKVFLLERLATLCSKPKAMTASNSAHPSPR